MRKNYFFLAAIDCIIDDDNDCVFTEVVINETYPFFQPNHNDPSNVISVIFSTSSVPILTDELCKAFPNLKQLDMDICSVRQIQEEALNLCANLVSFSININGVTEVSINLFKNNPEITSIDFTNNKLRYVDVKLFEPTKNLLTVDLRGNLLVHFDFYSMPVLQTLNEFYIDGNNLFDIDENAVIQKFPRLNFFSIDNNLLDCQNLKMMIQLFKDNNISIIGSYMPHNRRISFNTKVEEGIQCLDREEHLKVSSYYVNEMLESDTEKNLICPYQPPSDTEEGGHLMIVHLVSVILVIFCGFMVIWHGFYWKRSFNLFEDKGEYYYSYYEPF